MNGAKEQSSAVVKSETFGLEVSGYKAVSTAASIQVEPLTILAGANSSGKSSFMQPILLMKQTLDSTFDPGPLLINGPDVRIFNREDMFYRGKSRKRPRTDFSVTLRVGDSSRKVVFSKGKEQLEVSRDVTITPKQTIDLTPELSDEARERVQEQFAEVFAALSDMAEKNQDVPRAPTVCVGRNRCFLEPLLAFGDGDSTNLRLQLSVFHRPEIGWSDIVRSIIHVPGLRGNPERTYAISAVGGTFPGTFEKYVASVVYEWTRSKDTAKLGQLNDQLAKLGLTWKIVANPVNDAMIELRVGRTARAQQGGARDLVNVADVGFGVSQVLPVLVSLLVAEKGQLVFIEQPEIHLHPRAQLELAGILVDAAIRGVRVVVETHSSLMIRGIQTRIAEGVIAPELVSLNWFERDALTGAQRITRAELNRAGQIGEWPIDFDDISQTADWEYLDAAEKVIDSLSREDEGV